MLNKLKQTTKHTIIYSLGNLSNKLAGIILLPLYTAYLTTADYGIFSIFEVTLQFLIAVLGLNLHTAMLRFCSMKSDEDQIRSIVFTTFISSLLIVAIFLIPLVINSENLSKIFFQNKEFSVFFNIIFISMALGIFNRIILNVIRFRSKAIFFALITTLKFIIILLGNIYYIVYIGYGVKGLLLSRLISEIFLFLVALPFFIKNMRLKLNTPVFREMISYGLPLIFSTVSGMILNFSNRYIMKPLLGNAAVGLYSMGYKVAGLINVILIQSFQTGFLPIAYKMVDDPGAKRFYSKILTYFVFLLSIAALALSMYGREIFEIMARKEEWINVYKIIPLLTFLFVLQGIRYNFSLTTHYVKKTKYNAYIVMSAAILNIGLNFLLIQQYNIYGAAIASIISVLYMCIFFYFISQKLYYIPFELLKITKTIIIAMLLYFISLLFSDLNIFFRIIIKMILIISFPFILYFSKFFEPIEILRIQQTWKKWRNPKRWKKNMSKIKFR